MDSLKLENLSQKIQLDPMGGWTSSAEQKVQKQANEVGLASASGKEGVGFLDMLQKSLENVNEQQVQADQAIKELISGRSKNIHETLLAVERADSSLKLMMQVRNKVLDAYREIMRMQV